MYRPEWLEFNVVERQTLAEHYKMKKTVATEVFCNKLVCDGYADDAIYKIDLEEAKEVLETNNKTDEQEPKESTEAKETKPNERAVTTEPKEKSTVKKTRK